MAVIIRQRQVVADNWQLLKPAADGSLAVPAEGDVIVPLDAWRGQRDASSSAMSLMVAWRQRRPT